jgi:hypothetical protein
MKKIKLPTASKFTVVRPRRPSLVKSIREVSTPSRAGWRPNVAVLPICQNDTILRALASSRQFYVFAPMFLPAFARRTSQMDADDGRGVKPYFCMIWGLPAQFLRQDYE